MGRTESEEFLDQVLEEDVDENEEEENFSCNACERSMIAWRGDAQAGSQPETGINHRDWQGQAERMVGRSSGAFNRRAVVQCESDNKVRGIR
jgi:hypothetical protein